jgi:protein-ribulosamine 3-kinase
VSLNENLKNHIQNLVSDTIKNISTVQGGDISSAYKIITKTKAYFLKSNKRSEALDMFKAEAKSLQIIAQTDTIKTPEIIAVDRVGDDAFLLIEFVDCKSPNAFDMSLLGKQLANLHNITADGFGLEFDNFIGRLHQSNTQHKTWTDFYVHERLIPQLKLAKDKGLLNPLEIPSIQTMKSVCEPLFQNIKPALLHGDLWSGNYLIHTSGMPYLIDPAIYFGHAEVDIAMTKLFGGFASEFYNAYYEQIPKDADTDTRIELYQLYYLLVHLNLFGRSYYGSVISILKKYF